MIVQEVYKPTWLADIPEYWERLRIKNIFSEIDDRSETGKEELLSVSHYTGVTKKRDKLANENEFISNAKTLVGYKKVAKNDLVSNIMLAWNGSLGISKYNGITSPAYCVYRIKGNNNPDYFGYLFSTAFMKAEFRKKSYGIIDSRLRLYSDKFFSILAPVPPKTEQDKIVDYIKEQSKRIKHFIKKKKVFIELLKEQRQAVINKAVITGINPSVKLKDSGIYWLGDIPENWILRRLASMGNFTKGGNVSKGDLVENGEKAVILYGDIYTKYEFSVAEIVNKTSKEVAENATQIFRGDLLFTGSGEDKEDIGKCVTYIGGEEAYAGGDVVIFRQEEFDSEFVSYSQNSIYAKYQKYITSKGDIIVHQYGSKLKNVLMPFPSDKNEQTKIVSHIKTETKKIDQAIAQAQKEIELIKEYKEAMIVEAVIGKLKNKKI